jgi:S1-C subfamily serine protease
MNRTSSFLRAGSLLLAAAFVAVPVRADDLADSGRTVFNKYQHAVVTVQVVLKLSGGGRSAERKSDLTGTVVDPSGLTVLSLSACDPNELSQRLNPDASSQVETEVTDVKILLEDGTELPAEIVLRDKDLDLAYVRPKTKAPAPMDAIDLSKSAPAQVLEPVVAINRLNRAAGRAYAASLERISAVMQKPRTFYIPDSTATQTTTGSPMFTLKGDLVGIVVMRAVSAKGATQANARDYYTAVILPAEEILKGAKQAPEAKPETEKKEEPKTDSMGTNTTPAKPAAQ